VDEIPTESKGLNRKGRRLKFASIVGNKIKKGFWRLDADVHRVGHLRVCPWRWNRTTLASMAKGMCWAELPLIKSSAETMGISKS
jgi:hypothetical protein